MKIEDQLKLENQICFPIYSVSRLITKAYKPYLEKMGLTYPQYLVMLVLWEHEKLTVNQIGINLQLNTNTLSPLIKRMEQMELLKRTRSVKDERSIVVELTKKGLNYKKEAIPIPQTLLRSLISEEVELKDIISLKETLDKLINLLNKDLKNEVIASQST
ncbi:DNA-binding transcriptional regulator, MarR family [Gillisia sp. Hel1_33_143]|uniref:MarR family winged helix-turn-helix transcriptional regulator n=1 Tax=Gillisia sp. Hel1_33_143 TaxID=1336796 RepID=UPI00087936C3|nr:MarR family transcriptional regulator [Gillisia sp. Hel1_33_143]SDS19323.1 DNA-binding transcriptional regulator, MarR family [Gillisia sp. Hel1_33_143]